MKLEAFLLWILVSLLAISVVGDHPLVGLAIASAGGAVLGVKLVLDDIWRRRP